MPGFSVRVLHERRLFELTVENRRDLVPLRKNIKIQWQIHNYMSVLANQIHTFDCTFMPAFQELWLVSFLEIGLQN